ncbi:MAG: hypothetical protein RLP44_11965 [Aggregatilineales bacterium]
MSWQVYWIIENSVLYGNLSGNVTLEGIQGISTEIADHVEEAQKRKPQNVTIGIVDMREARIDMVVRALASARLHKIFDAVDARVWRFKPGFTVLIRSGDYVSMLVSVIIRISNQPMTTVGSLEEALEVITSMYPELSAQLDSYAQTD